MRRADIHPSDMQDDYTCKQPVETYTDDDHATWKLLYQRQREVLRNRTCKEFMDSLERLGIVAQGIPDFRDINAILSDATGWNIVCVPGLIPDTVFYDHLAKRQFPVSFWIRSREELDYLVEPDVFHDLFGHVPLLINPIFADYMEAFGRGGVKATKLGYTQYLARLYWFTVEFGLMRTKDGIRIYGSGIVSSKEESIYCLESSVPNRVGFDLKRIMRTDYRIDDLQKTYFVIDSFDQLFDATFQDFVPIYEEIAKQPTLASTDITAEDHVYQRGTIATTAAADG